eukprot:4083992-Pyramimonas_sp.AAC.1
MVSRRPKRPPRGFQDVPGGLQDVLQKAPRSQNHVRHLVCKRCWHLLIVSLPVIKDGPRGPQNRSKSAPKTSKKSHDGPRASQDGLQGVPRRPKKPPRRSKWPLRRP